eukprot:TRINITY_DN15005_c0_g1_i2.p1 TRINITY_DN15005_c0_g1~~TRINITY_DN15005_c0_g1_i2.p1  ORF type:complete len:660 (-),score=164.16 TRINITY_DN15005_c0_g1_i2:154-2133(-)
MPCTFFATSSADNQFDAFKKRMMSRGTKRGAKRVNEERATAENAPRTKLEEEIKRKANVEDSRRQMERDNMRANKPRDNPQRHEERRGNRRMSERYSEDEGYSRKKPQKRDYFEVRRVEGDTKRQPRDRYDRGYSDNPKEMRGKGRRDAEHLKERDYRPKERFNQDRPYKPRPDPREYSRDSPPKGYKKREFSDDQFRYTNKSEPNRRERRRAYENYSEDEPESSKERHKKMKQITLKKHEAPKIAPMSTSQPKASDKKYGPSGKDFPLGANPTAEEIKGETPEVLLSLLGSKKYCDSADHDALLDIINHLIAELGPEAMKSKEILHAFQFLLNRERLPKLTVDQLSGVMLAMLNGKVDQKEFWSAAGTEILSRKQSLSLNNLATILGALKRAMNFAGPLMDADKIFNELQKAVLKVLGKEKLRPKVLQKIIKTYVDSKQASKSFLKKLEEVVIKNYDVMTERVRANILLSLSISKAEDELFKYLKSKVFKTIEEKEIVAENSTGEGCITPTVFTKIVLSYHNRKLLDKEILEKIERRLLENYEVFYVANVPVLYSIFVGNRAIYEPEKAFKFINDCIDENVGELDIEHTAELYTDWNAPNCPLRPEVKKKISQHVTSKMDGKKTYQRKFLMQIFDCIKDDESNELAQRIASALEQSAT